MTTEARKRANKKWDNEHMTAITCRMRKEQAQIYKDYAQNHGLTVAKFASLSMQYCKNHEIDLTTEKE